MRRSLTAAAALLLAASLGLAGCSGDGKKSAKAAATSTSAATKQEKVDCSKLKIDTDSKALPTIGQPSITPLRLKRVAEPRSKELSKVVAESHFQPE